MYQSLGGISIVVPVFNKERAIKIFFDRLVSANIDKFSSIEVVLVDDGSTDANCRLKIK